MRNLRSRIERLEARQPPEIILTLRDGSRFYPRGLAIDIYMEAQDDIVQKRSTPLSRAVLETVSAEGFGLLWQLLQAIAPSPKKETEEALSLRSETK